MGSSQHIKNKFATGYEIEAKFKVLSDIELFETRKYLGLPADERLHL